jgi:GDP-L-fucose synthase
MTEPLFDLAGRRVFVAGHRGMAGSAVVRRLARESCEIVTVDRREVDLTRQADVESWMAAHRPDVVVVAAARVGGILANSTYPAEFIRDNLMIEANVIDSAWRVGVAKLLLLGSSCIYPKLAPQPIPEEALLSGPLEPTNEWYAIAKIAGIKLCQAYRRQYGCDFISAQPTNLYGTGDNFDLNASHVIPALMRKLHEARQRGDDKIVIWGTGTPLREFLHVDDLADAMVFLLGHYSGKATSISGPAKKSPSGIWRRRSPRSSASPVPSFTTAASRTAPCASCWMSAGYRNWAGKPAPP